MSQPYLDRWRLTPHTREHLRRLLERWPTARVTSGYRSPEHNRRVGGVPGSFHLRGRAVDVVPPIGHRSAFIAWCWRDRVNRRCTGPEEVIDEGDHVHVAW